MKNAVLQGSIARSREGRGVCQREEGEGTAAAAAAWRLVSGSRGVPEAREERTFVTGHRGGKVGRNEGPALRTEREDLGRAGTFGDRSRAASPVAPSSPSLPRMQRLEKAAKRAVRDTRERWKIPWKKPKEEKTFAELRMSKRIRAQLERKGVFKEDEAASKLEKGWMVASAAVLVRAKLVKPAVDEAITRFEEDKFSRANRRCVQYSDEWFRKEGVIKIDEEEDAIFEPGGLLSEADRRKDVRSLWRKLDRSLFFVFKSKESSPHFQFPQRVTQKSETMRYSARKALDLVAGSSIKHVHFSGHAPMAMYKRVFSEAQQHKTKTYGAKVFFYPAYLISGDIRKLDQGYDFHWLTQAELAARLAKDYYQAVQPMLMF